MEFLKRLTEIDHDLKLLLGEKEPDEVKQFIVDLLEASADQPGRAAKIRASYVLERMADVTFDLQDSKAGFFEKFDDVMKWIDQGLTHVAYLADPESKGMFLKAFETSVTTTVPVSPRDRAAQEAKRDQIKDILGRWDEAVRSGATEPRRTKPKGGSGGNIILPGAY